MRELANALLHFRDVYNEYLDATWRNPGGDADEQELRRQVNEAVPGAQHALYEVNMDPSLAPPPAVGGPVLHGLANTVFAHEEYGDSGPFTTILDFTDIAISELEERRRAAIRRRLNPLYWVDRLLRAMLGLPAYLASLLFRVPLERVEESPLALPLRLVGLVLEALGIFIAGRAAGWW